MPDRQNTSIGKRREERKGENRFRAATWDRYSQVELEIARKSFCDNFEIVHRMQASLHYEAMVRYAAVATVVPTCITYVYVPSLCISLQTTLHMS